MSTVGPAVRLLLVLSVLCGVAYPACVTALGQVTWPHQANGSQVRRDGRVVGSALIGQAQAHPGYLWGRPSAIGHDARTSGGSNLGPREPRLTEAIAARARALAPTAATAIPVDLVTASASGLDPHVSPAGARFQVARIAAARGVPPAAVAAVIDRALETPTFGVLGAPRVNVLLANLALDRQFGRPPGLQ